MPNIFYLGILMVSKSLHHQCQGFKIPQLYRPVMVSLETLVAFSTDYSTVCIWSFLYHKISAQVKYIHLTMTFGPIYIQDFTHIFQPIWILFKFFHCGGYKNVAQDEFVVIFI